MQIVDSIPALREARAALTGKVGVVPTMGALHAGHLSLVEMARADCDHVLVTIFINPTQFGPDEDLDAYPRDLDGDLAKLEQYGVDLVFTPTPAMMYPDGYRTYVEVEEITAYFEGTHRPEHFRGVTTVVTKLFNLTLPDLAYFGQKDAQQVAVLRRLVRDLNFPLEIVVGATMREDDGLALSSRNAYLNDEEREAALVLSRGLRAAAHAYENGERDPETLRLIALDVLNNEELTRTDYVGVVDARTFAKVEDATDAPLLMVVAAKVGKPRLLDNMLLPPHLNDRDGLTATLGVG